MVVVWLAVVLLLVPGIAAGQTGSPAERQAPTTTSPDAQPPATEALPQPQAPAPVFPERQPRSTPFPELPAPATTVPLQAPGLVIGVSPPGTFPIDASPRTPPPATIPSGPQVILPTAPPSEARPTRLFEFRPIVGVSEEYIDNFNRSPQNPQSNYRSMVSPGLQVLLDYGFLTGSASYTLDAFYDSLPKTPGFHHTLAALLAWQATPRLRLSVAESLLESDNPAQADRLQINQARQKFSSNQLSLTSEYSLGTFDTKEYYRRSDFTSQTSTTQSNIFGLSATKSLDRIHVVSAGYEYLTSDTTFSASQPGTTSATTLSGHQITASFSRDLTATTTAGISGAYAIRDQQGATGNTSFNRRTLSIFSNYILEDKIIVRSDIGVAQLTTDGSSSDPVLTSTSNISYWRGPAVFTLGIERGFAESFGQGQNFGVVKTSSYSGSVLYRFTPLLSGQINGSYRENEFTGAGGGTAGQAAKIYTAGLNITYQIARWLTGTIEAGHTNSQSSTGLASFTENRVRVSLNAILY
jgi:hypothetical protein